MFELLFAKNLFENDQFDTNEQIQSNIEKKNVEEILNGKVGMLSYEFRDVLIKLLQKDPDKRITIEELKKHVFFAGVVWEDIPLRKNPPPIRHFLETDHIKFRDPNNEKELAHRKVIDNRLKSKDYKTSLFEFRSSD